MAFINEKISEKDRARINWENYQVMPYADTTRPFPWTIDRERDAFFLRLKNADGSDSDRGDQYGLGWKGELIRIEANVEIKDRPGFMIGNIHWDILRVDIPESLILESQTIMKVIIEAINAYGFVHNRERVHEVHISIR